MDNLWSICTDFYFPRRIELRSQKTRAAYSIALNHYGRHLGRIPTLADLDDDLLSVWVCAQLDSPGSVYSVRERLGRILALWRFLAARGVVSNWPTIKRPPAPDPVPTALTQGQLRALFDAALYEPGKISDIRAGWWWQAFLGFVWITAERRGAALALRWEWVDLESGAALIPPHVRKGKRKAGIYRFGPELRLLLERIRMPPRELVFPWDASEGAYFYRFGRILERAGLPNNRKMKTHALRCSMATWLTVYGGNASRALGHSSMETTMRHYIDQRHLPNDQPKLFIPWRTLPPDELPPAA